MNATFIGKCIAVAIFCLWVVYGCATGIGSQEPIKLREYMYEGIEFHIAEGAHNNTQ